MMMVEAYVKNVQNIAIKSCRYLKVCRRGRAEGNGALSQIFVFRYPLESTIG